MLALPPLRDIRDERQREISMEDFSMGGDDFTDFSGGNFLIDSIDLDEIFVGINDGDVLPDLEMDPKILAEFSLSGGEESEMNNTPVVFEEKVEDNNNYNNLDSREEEGDNKASASTFGSFQTSNQAEEAVIIKPNGYSIAKNGNLSTNKESDKGRKSSSSANQSTNPQGKRKVKVDWTPELHRRFVQAVEQLGVDKAVPSRILELMGIDSLTRHNIASHLQKYRSHRKHLQEREAEAASWNQKRQVYGGGAASASGGKRNINTWLVPTMGFPPVATPVTHFRPLHVWGHPSVDQSLLHVWPKQLATTSPPPPPPPPTWTPHPPADPSFWHPHHQRATHCFGAPVRPTQRFQTSPVPGIPPPDMYKVGPAPPAPVGQTLPKPPLDFQPSRESVDAAIGDVLSKPWLPLPLRLKPPSVDSVLEELQKQGISEVP